MKLAALISGGGRTVLNIAEEIAAGRLDAEIGTIPTGDRPIQKMASRNIWRKTEAANALYLKAAAEILCFTGRF